MDDRTSHRRLIAIDNLWLMTFVSSVVIAFEGLTAAKILLFWSPQYIHWKIAPTLKMLLMIPTMCIPMLVYWRIETFQRFSKAARLVIAITLVITAISLRLQIFGAWIGFHDLLE